MLINLKKITFLDIETVPATEKFVDLSPELAYLWTEKFNVLCKRLPEKYADDATPAQGYETSAGIYSEFGKIICISVGFIHITDKKQTLRVTSFAGDDELQILKDFSTLITKITQKKGQMLCGHNIKEFDVPYICRRMIINELPLPELLQLSGKKPWETPFLDTLELWKFGDAKNYISLKLLTTILGIPTPKDDIDGSQVAAVYYEEKNIQRIVTYCQKDVVAVAQVYLKLNGLPAITDEDIIFV